jgi:Bifunctional DNA primase/polymerase, N-terminal/Primase C terminal 1 (PriCT-1)
VSELVQAAALEYCGLGWRVFALNGKTPLAGSRGCKDASDDPSTIASWPENCNVGIATGGDLVVLDVDEDGGDTLAELEREQGELPETVSAVTGGGQHYYFASRAPIRNSAGKLGGGLDVRGEGGYVVAPPSVHPGGRTYAWDNPPGCTKLAPLPEWLERLLAERENGRARPPSEWRQLVRNGVSEGQRNDATARLAGHLLARSVDAEVTLELLLAWNRQRNCPPLPHAEVARTVVSIYERELRKWMR